MNKTNLPSEPDWFLWRSFLAVMDEGSLSAAARALGASQPTIGRHIEELENCLSAVLFDRTGRGLKPTPIAHQLVEPVRNAKSALAEAQLAVTGATEVLDGTVRITASQIISHNILPAILMKAREQYPMIELEIVPSDAVENLLLREADIAIRMFRPGQLDVVGKKIGDVPLRACAHQSYLDKHGTPQNPQDLYDHEIIGLDRQDDIIRVAKAIGFPLERKSFKLRTDSQTLIWEMVKQGLGVSFAQFNLIEKTPGMVHIVPDLKIPAMEMWLVAHREVHKANRIRVIYDLLAKELTAYTRANS
ncbi:LysR family transcriptional regulator [Maritalea porphyrae]|jgi:DNA-binding transcriptional LysR family regulator|uniref:LysR family transcriptional regulator n=1 Tax=Maritalea porphyrae TaxID=880732 RepID=UPI0022AFD7B6|nr:LysR family transcriptional regulator [Maritalea porphyrae]MCZ4273960.1 LysR family transcriptional regulator [Maritalea porphyrae]